MVQTRKNLPILQISMFCEEQVKKYKKSTTQKLLIVLHQNVFPPAFSHVCRCCVSHLLIMPTCLVHWFLRLQQSAYLRNMRYILHWFLSNVFIHRNVLHLVWQIDILSSQHFDNFHTILKLLTNLNIFDNFDNVDNFFDNLQFKCFDNFDNCDSFDIFYNFWIFVYNFWIIVDNFYNLFNLFNHYESCFMTITKTILETCYIWDTDYNSDKGKPEFMTIFVSSEGALYVILPYDYPATFWTHTGP